MIILLILLSAGIEHMDDIFKNYSDVYFCCYVEEMKSFNAVVTEHSLLYVASGELLITLNGSTTTYSKGEAVFIKRNHDIRMVKRPDKKGVPFKSSFFMLQRGFLKAQHKLIKKPHIKDVEKLPDVVRVTNSPMIKGLFLSLLTYFDSASEPSEKLMQLKKEEALNSLLETDESFYACLFDFSDPWKIDLEEFMNKNFKVNLSIAQLAGLTARSVASFKRDFTKVFDSTPQRWIMHLRLQEAHRLVTEEKLRPTDIYQDLGFKNLAHFSSAFKKEFGATPNNISKI